jgi:SAM-dependent methyltransferase
MASESPDAVEQRTQAWLDAMMEPGLTADSLERNVVYAADGTPRNVSPVHFGRLRRKLKIFRWLDRLEFSSFLDLASGWEHYPYLVRQRYGVEAAYYSDMVHRVNLPLDGPVFGKLDHAVTLRLPRLPFPDQAFDVVVCTEVLEHLVRPVESLAELWRITRKHLILTSLEALSLSRWQRRLAHLRVDTRQPHVERNFFERTELEALFGGDVVLENQQYVPNEPVNPFVSVREQAAVLGRLTGVDALADALCRAVSHAEHGRGSFGLLLVKSRPGAVVRPPEPGNDARLARWLIEQAAAEERVVQDVFAVAAAWAQGTVPYPHEEAERLKTRPVAASLLDRLRCPDCRGALAVQDGGVRCAACAHVFSSEYGVPILYSATAADTADPTAALDLLCGSDAARRQVVSGLMQRLRRNEGPPSTARRLFWWLDRQLKA